MIGAIFRGVALLVVLVPPMVILAVCRSGPVPRNRLSYFDTPRPAPRAGRNR